MKMAGLCPMGCGETLRTNIRFGHAALGGDWVRCGNPDCPRPHAVTELLLLRDVVEHRVTFGAGEFAVIHPLRERFGNAIAGCGLDPYVASLDGPPVPLGVYLAEQDGDGWKFTAWTDER